VTPGATGLAVLDDATPAAARDTVVWASAGAIDPASPYTVAAGIDRVTFASSKTLAPRALSNYANGQTIVVTNSSASTITVTITPADGTIDGGASVALTVLAHAVVGCQRVSASAWVSLQPGSAAIKRITATVVGGAFVAYGETWIGGAWVQITPSVSPTVTGDPDGLGGTGSGTTITWSTGSAIISANVATEAQSVGWAFADIASGLGLDQPRPIGIRTEITSAVVTSGGASDYANLFGALGTSGAFATNMQYAIGIRCPNSGSAATRAVAAVTGLGSTGSASASIRRVFYTGPTPVFATQLGTVSATDVSDAFVNADNIGTSVGIAGTPTHFFVAFGASTTQRATVINGPFVRFYL
jgi:hypothetical protein